MASLLKINRRDWLTLWAQKRRRKRVRPVPVLRAVYPDLLQWDWDLPDPCKWNVWLSLDDGESYILVDGYWMYGDARQFAPDGGSELHFIVGVDEDGNEVTARSNAVRPDDSPLPDLTRGLVAHFGFDEANADQTDYDSGRVLSSGGPGVDYASGLMGYGAHFNGYGGYLMSVDETTVFSPTSDGFSVSLWVNFSSSNSYYSPSFIVSVWDDTNWPAGSSWNISSYYPVDGNITVEMLGTSYNSLSAQGNLLSGWTHVCVVFDAAAGLWSLYFNGVVAATLEYDYRPIAGRLGVGQHTNPNTGASEFIADELTIWSRNLSAVEVGQLYNGGSGLSREMF